jgi:cell division protease FtsH
MHATLGPVTWETARPTFLGEDALAHYAEREFSEATAHEIDRAVRELITAAFENALAILRMYRRQLDDGATRLLARETLTRDELPLLEPYRIPVAAAMAMVEP